MDIDIFTLCDAATDSQGKLNILGAFDTIFVRQLPARHPICAIAARLRFSRIEQGEHKVTIHIVDDDGKLLVPELGGVITITFAPHDRFATANLILYLQMLTLTKFGEHAINLAIDGAQRASFQLMIKQVTA